MDLYVPVTYTLWGIIAAMAYSPPADETGALLSTVPFHLANLSLHIASAVLCYLLIRRCLGERGSYWAAAAGAHLCACIRCRLRRWRGSAGQRICSSPVSPCWH